MRNKLEDLNYKAKVFVLCAAWGFFMLCARWAILVVTEVW